MDRSMDWKGKVLRRRYRLDERMTVGMTVEVFRGFDLLEENEVTVKLPLPHLVSDTEFCDNFRSAAHRATRLHNPGLVEVLDYGIEEGRPFVVMEIVGEKSLHELLEAGKTMKPLGALYFVVELGKILTYLHKQGVTHGSLDERHVFIYPGRKAKISDPGFPAVLGGGPSPYPVSMDPRRDIQDAGYLIYRSLTGRGKAEATEDIKKGKMEWSADVPPRLQRFVQQCMESSAAGGGFPSSERMFFEAVSILREELPMTPVPQVAAPAAATEEISEEVHAIRLPHLAKWQIWTGGALLAVALLFLLFWILSMVLGGSKVEVPNLVNMSVEEAVKKADESDLGLLVVGREYDADIKATYIISQDPNPGEMVEDKTVIKVLESLGPLTVPNLVGLNLDDARVVLESRGFRVGEIVYREAPGISDNIIIETNPPYGSKLSSGDSVDLVVSGGSSGS